MPGMTLTVLSHQDVRTLLFQLTKQDILDLQQSLADALHCYSTNTEDDGNDWGGSVGVAGMKMKRKDGGVVSVTPSSSDDRFGVKITSLLNEKMKRLGSSDTDFATSSLESLRLSKDSSSSNTTTTTTSGSQASAASAKSSLTLFSETGTARAFVNTMEITAFRTALASTMLFKKRANVHDVVVFGAGRQAYWHIRLALLLRGEDIHHLNIINRDFEHVHHLLQELYNPHEAPTAFVADPSHVPTYRQAGEDHKEQLARPKIQILTPSHSEYTRLLHATLRSSSVIFLCTQSPVPLFPAATLTNPEGRKKGRYIAAIGSLSPEHTELHPDILRQNVAPEHAHRHFHKHAQQGGAVVVDSLDNCLRDAGELVQARLGPEQVVELGELVMLKRDAEKRRRDCVARSTTMHDEGLDGGGVELGECEFETKTKKKKGLLGLGGDKGKEKKDHESKNKAHKSLIEWLVKGNVIYKSVGLGLMDVVVGNDLVKLADERGIGTRIENF
ncbi:ornithine cyclodeaminase mu-crystallin [Pyrenophora tritici-repentis]|nr:ornithine cyclodeaminase mu-crystallin [Pyrenophora tritici-repentis]KAI1686237.1 ornithine cyclodeaminase mu-crystallin [Pyrenophora tritici-repentis]